MHEHRYKFIIKAASKDAIKANGKEVLEDCETAGVMSVVDMGDHALFSVVGEINSYYFGRTIAKSLNELGDDSLAGFLSGIKDVLRDIPMGSNMEGPLN